MTVAELLSPSSPIWVVVAAFLGGGTGSAVVSGLIKTWQDHREDKRSTRLLAERVAGSLDGFASECLIITGRNRELMQSDISDLVPDVKLDLPVFEAPPLGRAWLRMNSGARQQIEVFVRHLKEQKDDLSGPFFRDMFPGARVRDFEQKAQKIGLEAIQLSDSIRAACRVKRPKEAEKEIAEIRVKLGGLVDAYGYRPR